MLRSANRDAAFFLEDLATQQASQQAQTLAERQQTDEQLALLLDYMAQQRAVGVAAVAHAWLEAGSALLAASQDTSALLAGVDASIRGMGLHMLAQADQDRQLDTLLQADTQNVLARLSGNHAASIEAERLSASVLRDIAAGSRDALAAQLPAEMTRLSYSLGDRAHRHRRAWRPCMAGCTV